MVPGSLGERCTIDCTINYPGVVWALGRPNLRPTLLLFKRVSAFELSWFELPSFELLN